MSAVKFDRYIDGVGVKHRTIRPRGGNATRIDISGSRGTTRLQIENGSVGWHLHLAGVKTLRALAHEILHTIGDREEPSA